MAKLKLTTILGTRPEIIRLSETIKRAEQHFDHTLVHTGQNFDHTLSKVFFEGLGLRDPDHYLGVAGADIGETVGNIIAGTYKLLQSTMPDAVLILGDTNSALAAISAKRLKIPVFHMEAGNRCFDENLPEELNRRMVDHISDVNLAYSENARRNLLREGRDPAYTFVTGSPMREVLEKNVTCSNVLERLDLTPQKYIVLSAHREENLDIPENFDALVDAINGLADRYQMPLLYSVHPRTAKRIEASGAELHPLVRTHEPFGFADYITLQQHSFCVVSDSGTLAEESAILGFPAVSARTSTERQEAAERGGFIVGGIGLRSLSQAVQLAVAHNEGPVAIPDYDEAECSRRVVHIIQSYTGVINRMVWRKPDA